MQTVESDNLATPLNDCATASSGNSLFPKPSLASELGSVREALRPVSDRLEVLNQRLINYIPHETTTASAVLNHVFSGGGKRIRPAIYYLCCDLLNYSGDHLHPIAAVCEFVHTASLLHDDVVDNSSLRRNKPTARSIWGDQASVLVGDLIYSTASEMMAATGSLDIVKAFAGAIRQMSEGELIQLENAFNVELSENIYFSIIHKKTAALLAAGCRSAAILANAPTKTWDDFHSLGASMGIAFQLVDDALDFLGSADQFGKATQSDLIEGKFTLPMILLRERMTQNEARQMREALARNPIDREYIDIAVDLVDKYGTAEETFERASKFTEQAVRILSQFPESPARSHLEALALRLVLRFH